jgi:ketosteroid isomerase-like protein
MDQTARIALVEDILAALLAGSIVPLLAAVTDDVSLRLTVLPGTPLSGEFKGKAGLETYFALNAETVETNDLEIANYLAGGDQVAVVGKETLKVIRSGEVHQGSDWVMIFTFRGDQIASVLVVEDTARLWAAYAR